MYEMEIPSDGEYIDDEGVRHIGAMQKSNIDARMNGELKTLPLILGAVTE